MTGQHARILSRSGRPRRKGIEVRKQHTKKQCRECMARGRGFFAVAPAGIEGDPVI